MISAGAPASTPSMDLSFQPVDLTNQACDVAVAPSFRGTRADTDRLATDAPVPFHAYVRVPVCAEHMSNVC